MIPKLGKLAPKRSLKALPLSNYMKASAVPFPKVHAWERPISYGMLANYRIGDCTCAGLVHQVMNWQAVANAGTPFVVTDQQVIDLYSAITGYDGTPATDNGANETDVLNFWTNTGFLGHKIVGRATHDVQNIDQIKAAIYVFGGVYIGFQVPDYIMADPPVKVWDYTGQSYNVVGGHAVIQLGYGNSGMAVCSWGDIYHMTWAFWQQFVDEAYAVVSANWLKQSGISPTGLDLNGLLQDSAAAPTW